jgi:hypothetical protein
MVASSSGKACERPRNVFHVNIFIAKGFLIKQPSQGF